MCSQINHSFMRKREEDLQFPSYLECYSELHILPRSSDAVGSGSATGLMCLNHSSISIPCPSRRDPGRLSPAALTEQGPDSTEHSQSYSLVKAAHSSDRRWLHPSYGCSWLKILAGTSHRCLSSMSVQLI